MADTILTAAVLRKIEQCSDDCRMGALLQTIEEFIDAGIAAGKFTQEEVGHDLEIALWIAYANNNWDDYEHYYRSEVWLKRVEDLAAGCGVWYYRYSVSLMYLGRLEEALAYAEKGVQEEPAYPWGWLNLAGLRSHFGDQAGALAAIEQGLKLEPGDYEFLRRGEEIRQGKNLEEMENHYICEADDQQLQEGGLAEELVQEKLLAVAGIICNAEQLDKVKQALGVADWQPDNPYCNFTLAYQDEKVDGCLQMNEAAASKLAPEWAAKVAGSLPELDQKARFWLQETAGAKEANALVLQDLVIQRDRALILGYQTPDEELEAVVYFDANLDIDQSRQENYSPALYDEADLAAVENHIEEYFGSYDRVMHELFSPDIHVDVCVIPPTPERNYYVLATCGMGARPMKTPEDLEPQQWARAEVLIYLPADWQVDSSDEEWYWPIRCLKSIARLPGRNDSWLGAGHTISYGAPLGGNAKFSGVILLHPQEVAPEAAYCSLASGDDVNFYQLFPLYKEEIDFKLENGVDALLEPMAEVSPVLDLQRPNTRKIFCS